MTGPGEPPRIQPSPRPALWIAAAMTAALVLAAILVGDCRLEAGGDALLGPPANGPPGFFSVSLA